MTENVVPPPLEFVQFWNEILVPKFVKYKHVLVGGLGKHSAAIFPKLEVNTGEKVMDAGAGFGDTAIMLAQRVGPAGHVTAIDCCDTFLDDDRKDAATEGIANVSFLAADIQFTPFQPEYDLVFARFGIMFFENPVAAMRNMRKALKPGGRFTMIVWRDISDNPWLGAADARYARALSLAALGKLEAAITDYDQVLSDPEALTEFTDACRHRAEAHCQTGEADAAAIGWQVWLDTTPGGAAYVQEMLWAHGYLRGAIGEGSHPG